MCPTRHNTSNCMGGRGVSVVVSCIHWISVTQLWVLMWTIVSIVKNCQTIEHLQKDPPTHILPQRISRRGTLSQPLHGIAVYWHLCWFYVCFVQQLETKFWVRESNEPRTETNEPRTETNGKDKRENTAHTIYTTAEPPVWGRTLVNFLRNLVTKRGGRPKNMVNIMDINGAWLLLFGGQM